MLTSTLLLVTAGAVIAMAVPLAMSPLNTTTALISRTPRDNTTLNDLEPRLSPLAAYLTPRECRVREEGMYQPMCCRHGYGKHHNECRKSNVPPIAIPANRQSADQLAAVIEVVMDAEPAPYMYKRDPSVYAPPRGIRWMSCDPDYDHSYCCRKAKDQFGVNAGLWYCPTHLSGLEP